VNPLTVEELVRCEVGSASYHDVAARVRRTMVEQALRLSGGNKTGAARILRISRQAVQQLMRSLEVPDGARSNNLECDNPRHPTPTSRQYAIIPIEPDKSCPRALTLPNANSLVPVSGQRVRAFGGVLLCTDSRLDSRAGGALDSRGVLTSGLPAW
jgi:hypothetical protein